ncbi:hypothetical protein KKB68_02915 [Patescibacteria group bacterium]|nr:hypothetical protein [Patescibacteria group bacterium]
MKERIWFVPVLLFGALLVGITIFAACSMAVANVGRENTAAMPIEAALASLPPATATATLVVPTPIPTAEKPKQDDAWITASKVLEGLMQSSGADGQGGTRFQLELAKYEKAKLLEATPAGDSWMTLRLCDKEGLCIEFGAQLRFEEGRWGIYEIRREKITVRGYALLGHSTTSPVPSQLMRDFFGLLGKNKTSEASALFVRNKGTSTMKIPDVVQRMHPLSRPFDIVVVSEHTVEKIECEVMLWNPGQDSKNTFCWLAKDLDGQWEEGVARPFTTNREQSLSP